MTEVARTVFEGRLVCRTDHRARLRRSQSRIIDPVAFRCVEGTSFIDVRVEHMHDGVHEDLIRGHDRELDLDDIVNIRVIDPVSSHARLLHLSVSKIFI